MPDNWNGQSDRLQKWEAMDSKVFQGKAGFYFEKITESLEDGKEKMDDLDEACRKNEKEISEIKINCKLAHNALKISGKTAWGGVKVVAIIFAWIVATSLAIMALLKGM